MIFYPNSTHKFIQRYFRKYEEATTYLISDHRAEAEAEGKNFTPVSQPDSQKGYINIFHMRET